MFLLWIQILKSADCGPQKKQSKCLSTSPKVSGPKGMDDQYNTPHNMSNSLQHLTKDLARQPSTGVVCGKMLIHSPSMYLVGRISTSQPATQMNFHLFHESTTNKIYKVKRNRYKKEIWTMLWTCLGWWLLYPWRPQLCILQSQQSHYPPRLQPTKTKNIVRSSQQGHSRCRWHSILGKGKENWEYMLHVLTLSLFTSATTSIGAGG